MKKILFFFFCVLQTFAKDGYFYLNSEKANFERDKLLLEGKVEFSHPLGKISAEKGEFIDDKSKKRIATFEGDVRLNIQPDGKIFSEKAKIDLVNDEIYFSSLNKKVECEKLERGLPLFFSCKTLFCKMKKGYLKKKGAEKIQNAHLLESVDIIYDNNFHLIGGKAEYINLQNEELLLLYPEPNKLASFFFNSCGISTPFVKLDLKKEKLFLASPHGEIKTEDLNTVRFSAKELFFSKNKDELELKYSVVFEKADFGSLKADRMIIQGRDKGIAYGKISLKAQNDKGGLFYEGMLTFDSKKIEALPKKGTKLLFKDEKVSILADQAWLDYSKKNSKYLASSITLQGQVCFFSDKIAGTESYGTADRVVYEVPLKRIRLIADNKNKVRFSQKDGLISFSSDEVLIQKNMIKGIGTVHFNFDVEREKYLKEIFSQGTKQNE